MSRDINKGSWLAGVATAFAIISCYGTGLLLGALSLLGISVALNERAWAAAISVFAALAAVLIGVSSWRRHVIHPAAVAIVGLALILWTMYGAYARVVELLGFAFLIVATVLDLRARAASRPVASEVSWIEVPELVDRLHRKPAPVVLDVRGADEFASELGHIPAALNLPVGDLGSRLSEIKSHKDKAVILVCRTDKRSAKAAGVLQAAGFRDVQVLRGGMEQWTRSNLPIEGAARASDVNGTQTVQG